MRLFSRKRSPLSERIRKIEEELASVNSGIKSLSQRLDNRGDELVRNCADPGRGRTSPGRTDVAGKWAADSPSLARSANRIAAARSPAMTGPGPDRAPVTTQKAQQAALSRGEQGERFANYLLRGGIDADESLRKERRVERNRAIFLILLFVMVSVLVVYLTVLR